MLEYKMNPRELAIGQPIRKIWQRIYWRFMTNEIVTVAWPVGRIAGTDRSSADPNDHYRPWLEKAIGRQGRDWQWDVHWSAPGTPDQLDIRLAHGHGRYAPIIALMWA